MARVFPKPIAERLEWLRLRVNTWDQDPGAVGLTQGEVDALMSAVVQAQERFDGAALARVAAENATQAQHTALDVMDWLARRAIARVKIAAAADPSVYPAASLSPPAQPTPAHAPPRPEGLKIQPRSDGAVVLSWKSQLSKVSWYTVRRIIDGKREELGTVRGRRFIDTTLPEGTVHATYTLTAHRAGRRGRDLATSGTETGVRFAAPTLRFSPEEALAA